MHHGHTVGVDTCTGAALVMAPMAAPSRLVKEYTGTHTVRPDTYTNAPLWFVSRFILCQVAVTAARPSQVISKGTLGNRPHTRAHVRCTQEVKTWAKLPGESWTLRTVKSVGCNLAAAPRQQLVHIRLLGASRFHALSLAICRPDES